MLRKIRKSILAILLLSSSLSLPTNAASYSVYLAGDSTFSDSISLNLSVSGSASMGGACGGVCGVTGVLNYDKSKIELMAASGLQGFDYTQGTSIVLYKSTAASDGGILSLRFRNLGLSSGESTTVSVTNLNVTNGDIEVGLGSASKTIQYVAPIPPSNPTPTPAPSSTRPSSPTQPNSSTDATSPSPDSETDTKSSEDEEEMEEQIKGVSKEKSKNASLSNIKLSAGELTFDKDILNYDVIVESDVEEIRIDAPTEDDNARADGAGTFKVKYGTNEYKIVVTAEDGTQKEYLVKVYRDGADEAIAKQNQKIIVLITIIAILLVIILGIFIYFIIKRTKKQKPQDNQIDPNSVTFKM